MRLNILTGRKSAGKLKEDIMKEVVGQLGYVDSILAVKIGYEIVRVTFFSDVAFSRAVYGIGLIHDSRHVGFHIVMQISHVLCWGANIEKKANCGKLARRNIEITLQKVHFELSTFYKKFVSFDCL